MNTRRKINYVPEAHRLVQTIPISLVQTMYMLLLYRVAQKRGHFSRLVTLEVLIRSAPNLA